LGLVDNKRDISEEELSASNLDTDISTALLQVNLRRVHGDFRIPFL
jgi:hypothetical protein